MIILIIPYNYYMQKKISLALIFFLPFMSCGQKAKDSINDSSKSIIDEWLKQVAPNSVEQFPLTSLDIKH